MKAHLGLLCLCLLSVAGTVKAEASLSGIQSNMFDELFSAYAESSIVNFGGKLALPEIPKNAAALIENRKIMIPDELPSGRFCGYVEARRIAHKYIQVSFQGRPNNSSVLSPYAKFADSDYWQVIYPE
ncbi:hypothetical protein L2725_12140 [Shewanella corallii]|uniref:Uncharacterized protein n=1 Tax=Shewanella corallii TaxID=560080 RepID=A0ABT0N7T2_9GAMM|nr:hypothetical protein [Shewanella corallii]MCL2914516.1 hypothetical protein [Shewanella corallii]